MMKHIIFAILCIWNTQLMYSAGFSDKTDMYIDQAIKENNLRILCFEFGMTTKTSVFITENENTSICDVIICDNNSKIITTECKKTPLLEWAFEAMEPELREKEFITNNIYHSFYYSLYLKKGEQLIDIESSNRYLRDDSEIEAKLNELKSFIINLWLQSQPRK